MFIKQNKIYVKNGVPFVSTRPGTPVSFDYIYYIMGITYISEVKNDIYGLHYDLL